MIFFSATIAFLAHNCICPSLQLRFDASLKKGAKEYLDSIMDDCDAAIHAEGKIKLSHPIMSLIEIYSS